MFPASCILLCLTVVVTDEHVFTYVKQWDPFRRTDIGCETCYKEDCVVTQGSRCEYYAEASRLISDDEDDDVIDYKANQIGDKVDAMLFELFLSEVPTLEFQSCVPIVSHYTDCTTDNICTGCNICNCNGEGKWICSEKQICRPERKLSVDNHVIGIVIENLKKNINLQEKRVKRSIDTTNIKTKYIKDKVTYKELSKWMYGMEPLNDDQRNIDTEEVFDYLQGNKTNQTTYLPPVTKGPLFSTKTSINKSDNYVDLLEFNDLLESWTDELSSKKASISTLKASTKHRSEEFRINDVDDTEYDPIRLIKRDISKLENTSMLEVNFTSSNFGYEMILTDALQGLSKITKEKQKELEELIKIQNNLLSIANENNITVDINSTITHDDYNKHHIAIYKLDTIEKCVAKVKEEICSAIKEAIKSDTTSNLRNNEFDLKDVFKTIIKYVIRESNKNVESKASFLTFKEGDQNIRRQAELNKRGNIGNTKLHVTNILIEINKTPSDPLSMLSQHARKILKRVIKQFYLDDIAVINLIVREIYYDFDTYMENIGTKWNKMMQDLIDSDVFGRLYRIKLLQITLKADLNKMEDMITLLEFARNKRMTIANGVTIDNSISRIQNNLQLINHNVQKIIKHQKIKKMGHASKVEKNKEPKKKSLIQKLKKMFQNSKNDIKNMLRKRFSKSEIIRQLTKKKIDELEKQRTLEYQDTMKLWQDKLKVGPERKKRTPFAFMYFAERPKKTISSNQRAKIKPMNKKNKNEKEKNTRATNTRAHEHKKKLPTNTHKTAIVSRRSSEP